MKIIWYLNKPDNLFFNSSFVQIVRHFFHHSIQADTFYFFVNLACTLIVYVDDTPCSFVVFFLM